MLLIVLEMRLLYFLQLTSVSESDLANVMAVSILEVAMKASDLFVNKDLNMQNWATIMATSMQLVLGLVVKSVAVKVNQYYHALVLTFY